jgi:hypothetical protein
VSRVFGRIAQIGYVVRDIHGAMDRWLDHGVGPWHYVERVQLDFFRYRGEDSPLEMSVALANSGDVQLELIQQRNDAPSMYKDFLDAGNEGMQHLAYWTTDFKDHYDRALSLGYEVRQEGAIGGERGRFAYLTSASDPGTAIEISDISGSKGAFFRRIREIASGWDGGDPIRIAG